MRLDPKAIAWRCHILPLSAGRCPLEKGLVLCHSGCRGKPYRAIGILIPGTVLHTKLNCFGTGICQYYCIRRARHKNHFRNLHCLHACKILGVSNRSRICKSSTERIWRICQIGIHLNPVNRIITHGHYINFPQCLIFLRSCFGFKNSCYRLPGLNTGLGNCRRAIVEIIIGIFFIIYSNRLCSNQITNVLILVREIKITILSPIRAPAVFDDPGTILCNLGGSLKIRLGIIVIPANYSYNMINVSDRIISDRITIGSCIRVVIGGRHIKHNRHCLVPGDHFLHSLLRIVRKAGIFQMYHTVICFNIRDDLWQILGMGIICRQRHILLCGHSGPGRKK